LQRQDVVAFYQRYAVPANMVLAIVGDIDIVRTTSAVEQAFAQFPARPVQLPAIPAEPPPTQPRRQVKTTQKQIGAIYIGFPGTTITNVADRYALHILDGIMSGIQSPSGWLHNTLRGRQLVYEVHALNWLGLEPGYFGIYAATQPQQVDEVIQIILQQVEKAKAGTIGDAELASAKQTAGIALRMQQQTNAHMASDLALHELYGLGYDFSAQEQQRLSQVSKADVQRVAQTYLTYPTIVITTPNPAQK
jgi:zinc protease